MNGIEMLRAVLAQNRGDSRLVDRNITYGSLREVLSELDRLCRDNDALTVTLLRLRAEHLERKEECERLRAELDVANYRRAYAESVETTLRAERDAAVALLDEVRQQFTRDDDLSDDLLPRIDAAIREWSDK